MESPPPTMEYAPARVVAATLNATARVPSLNFSSSNTPTGPFHRIVLESLMTFAIFTRLFGPISRASQLSGMLLSSVTKMLASLLNLSAQTLSTRQTKFTPEAFTWSRISCATGSMSGS